jgi:hypothetical protein
MRRYAMRLLRQFRWSIVAVLSIAVAVAGALGPSPLGAPPPAAQLRGAPATTLALTAAERSNRAIADDVAEVLRLSGVTCNAQYDGDGSVSVRGHLGNPQALSKVIQSRAMREIVGLKRVLAFNLDDPGHDPGHVDMRPADDPSPADTMRIVSAISSEDSYVVTADGSRYYVGAALPQGGRLTGVQEGEVLVERNGQVEHLKLPGTRPGVSNHQEKRT